MASLAAILVLATELFTKKTYFSTILYSQKLAYVLAILLGTYHLYRLVIFVTTHSVQQILHESIWQ